VTADFSDVLGFSKENTQSKSMSEIYKVLKDNAKPVCEYPEDKVLDQSKYVKLARRYNLKNYRLVLYKDLKNWGIYDSFTKYQKSVFANAGATIAILNELNGNLVSVVFRSTTEKEFINYSLFYSVYGFDMIDDNFRFGDYIVVTEGLYDADVLRQIYPNVVATQTSNVTLTQSIVLKLMTDKFIIAFDSDSAGDSGLERAIKRLGDVKHLSIYPKDKDIGNMEEYLDKGDTYNYEIRKSFYKERLDDCLSDSSIGMWL
jgi:hypothetical protein